MKTCPTTHPRVVVSVMRDVYFYTFVTVKKILTEWSCAIRLPWNIGTKVEYEHWHQGCMNYSYLIFSLPAITGSPSSKYEHQRASALLRNIQNIRIT